MLKNLSVPEESGHIFTKPDFKSWPSIVYRNKTTLDRVDQRDKTQNELVHAAIQYTDKMGLPTPPMDNKTNVVATGHQPFWHHCGILAKHIVTDQLAQHIKGTAIHLVLDHDICHAMMELSKTEELLYLGWISPGGHRQNIPFELMPVPDKKHIKLFIEKVSQLSNAFCASIWSRNPAQIMDHAHSFGCLADVITWFHACLHQALGQKLIYLPVSLLSQTHSFMDYLCTVMDNASSFAVIYNTAIKQKRQADKIIPSQTPRTLKCNHFDNRVELPFWIVSDSGHRSSLYVSQEQNYINWGIADKIIGRIDSSLEKSIQLREILVNTNNMIRPKAVTLTLFARLYLSDLFVHGIGATNYEDITDSLLINYYGISNVDYGIATATMYMPTDTNNIIPMHRKDDIKAREYFFGLFPENELKAFLKGAEEYYDNSVNCRSAP